MVAGSLIAITIVVLKLIFCATVILSVVIAMRGQPMQSVAFLFAYAASLSTLSSLLMQSDDRNLQITVIAGALVLALVSMLFVSLYGKRSSQHIVLPVVLALLVPTLTQIMILV